MPVPHFQTILTSRENTTQLADEEATHVRFDPYQRASGPVLARLSGGIGDRAGCRWHDTTFRHAPGSISTLWSAQHDESFELVAPLTRKERKSSVRPMTSSRRPWHLYWWSSSRAESTFKGKEFI